MKRYLLYVKGDVANMKRDTQQMNKAAVYSVAFPPKIPASVFGQTGNACFIIPLWG